MDRRIDSLLAGVPPSFIKGMFPKKRTGPTAFFAALVISSLMISALIGGCAASQEDASIPPALSAFNLVGHRGARGLLPENSLPSFRRALELGVNTLEIDVVISKDSQVVVSHEPWMHHLICSTPEGAPVSEAQERSFNLYEMTYEEIARFDCGTRGHPDFPRQEAMAVRKPLLREVIEMAETYAQAHERPPVWYNIEIKSKPAWDSVFTPPPEPFMRRVYEVLAEEGVTDRTIIQSFDPRPLRVAHRLDSSLEIALLVGRNDEQTLAENIEHLGFTPEIYSPNYHLVDAALVEAVHARGMRLVPWTVNTLEEMERLKALGVDGLITDYPDLGRKLLQGSS